MLHERKTCTESCSAGESGGGSRSSEAWRFRGSSTSVLPEELLSFVWAAAHCAGLFRKRFQDEAVALVAMALVEGVPLVALVGAVALVAMDEDDLSEEESPFEELEFVGGPAFETQFGSAESVRAGRAIVFGRLCGPPPPRVVPKICCSHSMTGIFSKLFFTTSVLDPDRLTSDENDGLGVPALLRRLK